MMNAQHNTHLQFERTDNTIRLSTLSLYFACFYSFLLIYFGVCFIFIIIVGVPVWSVSYWHVCVQCIGRYVYFFAAIWLTLTHIYAIRIHVSILFEYLTDTVKWHGMTVWIHIKTILKKSYQNYFWGGKMWQTFKKKKDKRRIFLNQQQKWMIWVESQNSKIFS